MTPLVVVLGPTAAGKSEIAVELALKLSGEIVSADSVQVYKYLDIGTARITPGQQKGVAHHLLGFLEPDEEFTAAQYQQLARETIDGIAGRGRLPILAGGTGLYIQAVIDPYEFPSQEGLMQVRQRLHSRMEAGRGEELYAELQQVDPEAAGRIHPHDQRRITRALEVYQLTQRPISSYRTTGAAPEPRYNLAMIGLSRSRPELYRRIDLRVDQMFRDGLVDEVRGLLERGCQPGLKPLQTLGYRQVISYLAGEYDLDTAISLVKQATRNYAKRQLTWFGRDSRIRWWQLAEDAHPGAVSEEIAQFICRSIPVNVE
ncbi:MAG: tRNA (adenosine(37)-N6)-dimethylallyltransferase MiaA [Thermacetogeniaceae bacterium]